LKSTKNKNPGQSTRGLSITKEKNKTQKTRKTKKYGTEQKWQLIYFIIEIKKFTTEK
jgi:hypothetical protein